ncbi:hypothetical protein KCP74_03275 [Salmonella enterica subsp. enterica]|nr:hypothetical protein KCP74_03275 [Salmonella enterica subsp. enterica]
MSLDGMLNRHGAATCAPPPLALNRDIMLRSLLLQLCFERNHTVSGARLGSDIIAVNAVDDLAAHLYGLISWTVCYAVGA